ncbi:hypothetical protein [Hymenobacter metallicola]|uniref:Uncharacterized protein n=1 Tax=Hymenobacter metallicola TaxID=2563114 RepID=A0A4Z0QBV0_9BACT|nr:hypothetical protein [Hymenobacter metallicola]TGE27195.1 hypothetical protein E5K02_12430 [Hymenobacter metallicola]
MNNTSNLSSPFANLVSWLFGFIALAIGMVNIFWGNDPGFGIFISLLALVFFPPLTTFIKDKTGLSIHRVVKWVLALFILWAAIGVGELFDKIDLMMNNL